MQATSSQYLSHVHPICVTAPESSIVPAKAVAKASAQSLITWRALLPSAGLVATVGKLVRTVTKHPQRLPSNAGRCLLQRFVRYVGGDQGWRWDAQAF